MFRNWFNVVWQKFCQQLLQRDPLHPQGAHCTSRFSHPTLDFSSRQLRLTFVVLNTSHRMNPAHQNLRCMMTEARVSQAFIAFSTDVWTIPRPQSHLYPAGFPLIPFSISFLPTAQKLIQSAWADAYIGWALFYEISVCLLHRTFRVFRWDWSGSLHH